MEYEWSTRTHFPIQRERRKSYGPKYLGCRMRCKQRVQRGMSNCGVSSYIEYAVIEGEVVPQRIAVREHYCTNQERNVNLRLELCDRVDATR